MSALMRNAATETDSDHTRAREGIVGTWLVTYTGGFAGEAFIQWHSDGTEWENIDYPILGGTICMSDWKATGDRRVRRSHVGWLYTNGNPSGYFTETETDEVARDGASYSALSVSEGPIVRPHAPEPDTVLQPDRE